jgi:ubiquinone/menaquinone biosynthesis C-methylase UbiE
MFSLYHEMMPYRFKGDFSRLESEERKKILPVGRILREMKIQRGDILIDFGCGIGYFSIPALDFVGDKGTVIAVDVSDEMLQELIKRVGHRKNLKIIHGDSLIGLKANVILLSMVLHEVDNPKEFLQTCFGALKPYGRVIVIDWQKKETGSMGPPVEERLAKEEVLQLTERNYCEHPIHEWMYFLEFTKD